MNARREGGDAHPAPSTDSEIEFTGYDPYIVAITGGDPADRSPAADTEDLSASRKVRLMAWLREHRS